MEYPVEKANEVKKNRRSLRCKETWCETEAREAPYTPLLRLERCPVVAQVRSNFVVLVVRAVVLERRWVIMVHASIAGLIVVCLSRRFLRSAKPLRSDSWSRWRNYSLLNDLGSAARRGPRKTSEEVRVDMCRFRTDSGL